MMEAHESDGGVDQNDEVAVFLKSYTPEGAVGFALHLRDGYKRENADLLAKVEQLEAERSEVVGKVEKMEGLLKRSMIMLPAYIAGTADINPASEKLFYEIQDFLNSLKTR